MAAKRINTTKYDIIRTAVKLFFEKGYTATSPKMVCNELGISTGNLTYYFPTKENMLALVVEMLCDFQQKMLEYEVERGIGSVGTICLETMTVAVACAQSEIASEFFIAAFQSELCRNSLRAYHVQRAKRIFAEQCADWSDARFHQAELLIIGLQYASIVPNDADIPLKTRIAGALDFILAIYNVDEATRQKEIENVLEKDCRAISRRVLEEFEHYVEKTTNCLFAE